MQRRYRLKASGSFRYIYKRGKSVSSKSMVLLYVPSNRGLHIGLSVGKTIGSAVRRNRVKRLLRENLRELIPAMDHGFNYVFIARPFIVQMNFSEIKKALIDALTKAGKLKDCSL